MSLTLEDSLEESLVRSGKKIMKKENARLKKLLSCTLTEVLGHSLLRMGMS
jgi:hypothetical protein